MPTGVYERTPEMQYERTPEMRAKASASRRGRNYAPAGEAHYLWAGDDVKYSGLHVWVARHKGRSADQPCTHADATCVGPVQWANISGEYRRDLDDFTPLCVSHHRRFDAGRIAT